MDPRAARSRAALHAAVLEATREQPIASVSAGGAGAKILVSSAA